MRAVVVDRDMEPGELRVRQIPEPAVVAGTVQIDVRAAGCNFRDILLTQGRYQQKPPHPFVPGAEVAGTVRAIGSGVSEFSVGDRVYALPELGGFAEIAVASVRQTRAMPENMPWAHGAALPIVYPTSYGALVDRASLKAGETLLVHAAAGGVGLAAVQIGRALGARVIATAGGREKLEIAREAGAHVVVDYREEDFVERVFAETSGRGADVIYDSVGGDTFDRSLKCIAWNGRLAVIGFASGRIPELKVNRVLLKNIAVTGIHWPAWEEHQPERVDSVFEALSKLYAEGAIRPVIGGHYPLERANDALVALASRKTHGKLILDL